MDAVTYPNKEVIHFIEENVVPVKLSYDAKPWADDYMVKWTPTLIFAHLCLEADRRTGRHEADQSDLARRIGKSRRIVGKYVEELEQKGVCTIQRGRNQYARTCFEIRDQYWPYRRANDLQSNAGHERNAFVDAIRDSFVSLGCTTGKFSSRDACLAGDWQQRGIPLNVAQDALLMGACRKYSSWLNSGPTEPIGSLAYFESLIAEMQERPLPQAWRA